MGTAVPLPSLPLSQRNKLCSHGRSEQRCGSRAGRSQGDAVDAPARERGRQDKLTEGNAERDSFLPTSQGQEGQDAGAGPAPSTCAAALARPGQPLHPLPSRGSTARRRQQRGCANLFTSRGAIRAAPTCPSVPGVWPEGQGPRVQNLYIHLWCVCSFIQLEFFYTTFLVSEYNNTFFWTWFSTSPC